MSSNPVHDKVYSIQPYVIKFVSDLRQVRQVLRFPPPIKPTETICMCYQDVNWLIPKISACRARIWSLLDSERSERVTNFICCRAGWYFSVSIIFTFRWHMYHLKSTINTDTSIFVFSREKLHDSKYSKYASLKP